MACHVIPSFLNIPTSPWIWGPDTGLSSLFKGLYYYWLHDSTTNQFHFNMHICADSLDLFGYSDKCSIRNMPSSLRDMLTENWSTALSHLAVSTKPMSLRWTVNSRLCEHHGRCGSEEGGGESVPLMCVSGLLHILYDSVFTFFLNIFLTVVCCGRDVRAWTPAVSTSCWGRQAKVTRLNGKEEDEEQHQSHLG